jgi:hypothetical protein
MNVPAKTTGRGSQREEGSRVFMAHTIPSPALPVDYLTGNAITSKVTRAFIRTT